jgi:hypothetical protein
LKHLHLAESLTIAEFCACEGFSVPTFNVLRKLGLTPEESFIPGTPFARITPEARAKWRKEMEQPGRLTGLERCAVKSLRQLAHKHRGSNQ